MESSSKESGRVTGRRATLRLGGGMSTSGENSDYLLDNADPVAERRFEALGHLFDAPTIAYLAALGVTRGWSCWEVGAGGGTIAEWLAGAVAPTGSVLATDLDLRRLSATAVPGLTAMRHDVVHDEIPTGAYDLVHARLLLVHLPERERVLDSLVRSLRPGGWVVIEDFDNMFLDVGSAATPEQAVVRTVALAFKRLLEDRGADPAYARGLPDLLRARGLRDIAGEGRIVFGTGGSPASRLAAANYSQVAEDMVRHRLCTSAELRSTLELLEDPDFGIATHLLISAWGRRPS
jgi:SAM-dependent methyltransferase